jgi:hypothetical protein
MFEELPPTVGRENKETGEVVANATTSFFVLVKEKLDIISIELKDVRVLLYKSSLQRNALNSKNISTQTSVICYYIFCHFSKLAILFFEN